MTMSDRMVVMKDGRVAQMGPPAEIYARPENVFVATFVGSPKMNILNGAIEDQEFRAEGGTRISAPDVAARAAVTFGVRPDDLLVTPTDSGVGVVALVELLGPRAILHIDAGADRLTSVVDANRLSDLPQGTRVDLQVRTNAQHLFHPVSGTRLAA